MAHNTTRAQVAKQFVSNAASTVVAGGGRIGQPSYCPSYRNGNHAIILRTIMRDTHMSHAPRLPMLAERTSCSGKGHQRSLCATAMAERDASVGKWDRWSRAHEVGRDAFPVDVEQSIFPTFNPCIVCSHCSLSSQEHLTLVLRPKKC